MYFPTPIFAVFYWLIGDTAPNLQQFEDIPALFISLFQMFFILVIFLVFAGMLYALLDKAAPGVTTKIKGIFKL